jgi:N-acetylated-alpha-linked acidic dipeptidase
MRQYLAPLHRAVGGKGWDTTMIAPLAAAIGRLERSAQAFATQRDNELARGMARPAQAATNTALLKVERAFARPSGLKGRPWYRSLIYVADIDNGYANMNFPGVNEAIRANDRATTQTELTDLTQRFGVAADLMDQATRLLTSK